jgi:Lipid A 3-O-deacylase (PagL)
MEQELSVRRRKAGCRCLGSCDRHVARGQARPGQSALADVGITPVFRLARGYPDAVYFKGGFLGVHLFSNVFMYEGKIFGSTFRFGLFLGGGVDFGDRHQYTRSYRFQHMSNAGMVEPNQGVNLSELHVGYFF